MSNPIIIIANSMLLVGFSEFTVGENERVEIVFELNEGAGAIPTITPASLLIEVSTDPYAPFTTFATHATLNGILTKSVEIATPGVYRIVYTQWVVNNVPPYSGPSVVASASFQTVNGTVGLPSILPISGDAGEVLTRTGDGTGNIKYLPAAGGGGGGGFISCSDSTAISNATLNGPSSNVTVANGPGLTVNSKGFNDAYPNALDYGKSGPFMMVEVTINGTMNASSPQSIDIGIQNLPTGFVTVGMSAVVRNVTTNLVIGGGYIGRNTVRFDAVAGDNFRIDTLMIVMPTVPCP